MGWISGIAVYFVVWWITLFAVLPLWTRPRDSARDEGGWRGAPENPHLWRKILVNSVVAGVVWGVIWLADRQNWLGLQPPA